MPYSSRRYRRSSYYVDWSDWHERQRSQVRKQFGGIDEDVVQTFLSLGPDRLSRVFDEYAEQYGSGPARYAKSSYRGWQSGDKGMAGQTLERLLEIVPSVLDFESKVRLYQKLRNSYRKQERMKVRLSGPEDLELVAKAARRIAERAKSETVPDLVAARLSWLTRGDGLAARALVSTIEQREGDLIASAVRSELESLYRLLTDEKQRGKVEHIVDLPCGIITVNVSPGRVNWIQRWFMSRQKDDQRGGTASNLPAVRGSGQEITGKDIIDYSLSQEGSKEIVIQAQKEALRLAAKKREGDLDSENAEKEIEDFLVQADEATRLRAKTVEMEGDFKRASGKTRITVKKGRWWWPFS